MNPEQEMGEEEANTWLAQKWESVQGHADVEEFEQINRAGGFFTKVWYRPLGFDFMAETQVTIGRGYRRLTAVAIGRERCMERLTEYVLEYLHPTGRFRTKREMMMFYNAVTPWRLDG